MIAIPTIGQTDEPNIDVNCLGGKPNAPIRMEVLAIEILRECGADGWVEKYENDLAALA